MDNSFGDISKSDLTDGQFAAFRHHDFQDRAVGFPEPAGEHRTVDQRELGLAPSGAAEVLGLGEGPIDTRRGDVEHIRRVALRNLVEQLRCRPRQRRQRIEIETLVAVGDHGDAGRPGRRVDHDIVDFVACACELVIEQLDHLRLRRQIRRPQLWIRCHGELLILNCLRHKVSGPATWIGPGIAYPRYARPPAATANRSPVRGECPRAHAAGQSAPRQAGV